MNSVSIIGGPGINKRRDLDFYPTPRDCTVSLLKFLNLSPMTIWEPACGTGEISIVLQEYGHNVVSTDLRYTGFGNGGIDYLNETGISVNAIITNPPFCISEQFIRKAIKEAEIVAMLLKSQFWHAKKRYELFHYRRPAYIMPLTWRPDFVNGGKGSPTMDFQWTVWLPYKDNCEYVPLLRP